MNQFTKRRNTNMLHWRFACLRLINLCCLNLNMFQVLVGRKHLLKSAVGLDAESMSANSDSSTSSDSSSSDSEKAETYTPFATLDCSILFTKKFITKKDIGDAHKGWVLARLASSGLPLLEAQREALDKMNDLIHAQQSDECRNDPFKFIFHRRTSLMCLDKSLYNSSYNGSYNGPMSLYNVRIIDH